MLEPTKGGPFAFLLPKVDGEGGALRPAAVYLSTDLHACTPVGGVVLIIYT